MFAGCHEGSGNPCLEGGDACTPFVDNPHKTPCTTPHPHRHLPQAHFRTQGTKTAAQKQRQIEDLKSKINMPTGGTHSIEDMLNAATDFTMVGRGDCRVRVL